MKNGNIPGCAASSALFCPRRPGSCGGRSAKVTNIIKKSKVTFSVYEDAGRTQEPGAGGRYPIVYVVDDTGRMIYRGRSDLEATEAVVTAIPDVGKKKRKR